MRKMVYLPYVRFEQEKGEAEGIGWYFTQYNAEMYKSLRELHLHGVLAPPCRSFSSTLPHESTKAFIMNMHGNCCDIFIWRF